MARPLLWLLFVPWTLPTAERAAEAQPELNLLAPRPEDGWVAGRAGAIILDRLQSLGFFATLVPNDGPGVYRLRAEPKDTQDPAATLTLSWSQGSKGAAATGQARGDAQDLEALAARIAGGWAERAGRAASPEEQAWISRRELPFSTHALLAAGQAQLAAGDARRAVMKLEQATVAGGEFSPEAQRLLLLAKRRLAASDEARRGSELDLALSALERARVAASRDRVQEAIDAYHAYASYAQEAARPVGLRRAVEAEAARLWPSDRRSHLELGQGRAYVFDDASGALEPTPSRRPFLALHEGDRIVLEGGRRLLRVPEAGKPRFALTLPEGTSLHPSLGLPVVRGFAALAGGPRLAWVDLGLGSASPSFEGRALAAGEEGLLVWKDRGEGGTLAFHRPGRHQPSFEVELELAPASASLVRGRVILEVAGALQLHDAETGRRRPGAFPVGPGVVHLGGEGRYAAFAQADGRVLALDVLGGEPLGVVEGPGRAHAALGHEHGLALLFDSGDVLYVDREGLVRDRARVPGRPLAAAWASATRALMIVLSTEGVHFLAPPNPDLPRDVDVALELAQLYRRAGRPEAALRLATQGARWEAGRVDALESLRAELLRGAADGAHRAAREAALTRARAAADPRASLPRFSWGAAVKGR